MSEPLPYHPNAPNAALRYRSAQPHDAPAIRDLLLDCSPSAPPPSDYEAYPGASFGKISSAVCELRGELVAVLYWRDLIEEIEILDLAVAPRHRRRGVAAFLIKSFLEESVPPAARMVFLEVRESNSAAIALYKKYGFEFIGRRPNYYRDPVESARLMSCTVGPS